MRARGIIGGFGLLAGLGAFFLHKVEAPTPEIVEAFRRRHGRRNPRDGRSNNPRGTVPNRGLKRIQGRQAAR